jgi:hypothetical protein
MANGQQLCHADRQAIKLVVEVKGVTEPAHTVATVTEEMLSSAVSCTLASPFTLDTSAYICSKWLSQQAMNSGYQLACCKVSRHCAVAAAAAAAPH